jgi:DNA repair photolyase
MQCKTALNRSGIPGADWCLNPYLGCRHACAYCYASFMCRFSGISQPWGTFAVPKENIDSVLAKQLRRIRTGSVVLSSVTDAYQPEEERWGLTRACLKLLSETDMTVSILTKGDLVTRDLDVLRRFRDLDGRQRVSVGFSITTLDDDLARVVEPGAAAASRRLAALEKVSAAGIETWVFLAPLIPGVGDRPEVLSQMVGDVRSRGAGRVDCDPLNFYPAAVSKLSSRLSNEYPALREGLLAASRHSAEWREEVARIAQTIVDGTC